MEKEMGAGGARIVALTADLLFAARIRGSAPGAVAVQSLDRLLGAAGPETRLVLVDLQAREGVAAVERVRERAGSAEVVAFAPHVAVELLEAARAAGAERVMVRGQFVRELPTLVLRAEG